MVIKNHHEVLTQVVKKLPLHLSQVVNVRMDCGKVTFRIS